MIDINMKFSPEEFEDMVKCQQLMSEKLGYSVTMEDVVKFLSFAYLVTYGRTSAKGVVIMSQRPNNNHEGKATNETFRELSGFDEMDSEKYSCSIN